MKNNNEVKYNYREEEKKKKKSKHLLWLLLLLLFLAVAITTVIIIGISNAWFSWTQKMEGDFKFDNGIVMDLDGVKLKTEEDKSFYLIQYPSNNPLNEMNVRWSDSYTLVNPTMAAAKGSSNFFLRVKMDYSFTKTGYDHPLNLEELADALHAENPSVNYTAENVLSYIFEEVVTFGEDWLYGGDGWFYYVGDLDEWTNTNENVNYEDLKNYAVTEETEAIKLFKENELVKPKYKVVPGEGNDMETFYVSSCKIVLTINACEAKQDAFESAWA